jgi:autotransporter-associated beta strand protein
MTLTGTNTYTGATLVNNNTLAINGATGALAGSAAVNVGDGNGGAEVMNFGLAADVWAGGTLNRINDAANVTLNGSSTGGLNYTGPSNGDALTNVETIGTLTFSNGRNNLTLAPGTGNEVQITTGTLVRANNGTGVVRGANLNGTGAGSTRLVVTTTAGVLTGGAGADGATNKSIIRYLLGDTAANGAGSGFVTLDGTNGVRLLAAAEYDATIAGDASLRNVSTAGGETVSSSVTINSLRLTGGTTTLNSGVTVHMNNGAILFTDAAVIGGGGTINFGANDGIIHLAKNTTVATASINTRLMGTGGLAYGRSGDVANIIEFGGDNTVIGNFINNQGTVRLTNPGALNDNYPMTYLPRPGTALLINGNNVTLRDIQAGGGTGTFQNGAATAATLTTYLTAARALNVATPLQNGGTGALNFVLSGGANTLTTDQDSSATGSFEVRTGTLALNGTTGTINDFTSVLVSGAGTLRYDQYQHGQQHQPGWQRGHYPRHGHRGLRQQRQRVELFGSAGRAHPPGGVELHFRGQGGQRANFGADLCLARRAGSRGVADREQSEQWHRDFRSRPDVAKPARVHAGIHTGRRHHRGLGGRADFGDTARIREIRWQRHHLADATRHGGLCGDFGLRFKSSAERAHHRDARRPVAQYGDQFAHP